MPRRTLAETVANFWNEFGDDRQLSLEEQVSRLRHHYAGTVGYLGMMLELLDDHAARIQQLEADRNLLLGEKGRANDEGKVGELLSNQHRMQWLIIGGVVTIITTVIAAIIVYGVLGPKK